MYTTTVTKRSDYAGEYFYENDTLKFINHEEGRIVMTGTSPEYQYHLKDHLGNVRLTFTTRTDTEQATATLEDTAEENEFLNYDEAVKIISSFFDHTNRNGTGTRTSTRLVGGNSNEIYGLAKSLSVMPGDTVSMEVYAKYLDTNPANWSQPLSDLMTQVTAKAPQVVIDGGAAGSLGTQQFPFEGYIARSETETGPKAYLNYIIFNREFLPLDFGYVQVPASAKESGDNAEHAKLAINDIVVTEPGYVYIYLSNENETEVEVYFDDFGVEHVKGAVIQTEDYYPFGLTFNSYSRESSVPQDYKFNGKEEQNELGLGWIDYGLRMYQPDIGRWGVIDPAADKYYSYSPFVYCGNSPTNIVDPNGADWIIERTEKDGKVSYNITLNAKVYNNSGKKLDMGALTKQMKSQLESTFSTGNIDGDIEVNTTVNIEAVSSLDDVKDTDHLVTIEDDQKYEEMASEQGGVNTNGYADAGGLKIVLPHKTAAGILDGTNTRTISHEFGHTGGLYHPDGVNQWIVQGVKSWADGNNLMFGNASGGKSIKAAQIQAMYNYYQAGRINQQTQFKREGHIMFTPALNPGLMYYQTRGGVNYTGQKWVDWKDRVFGPSN